MKKIKKKSKIRTTVMLSNHKDFFARGKAIAKALDKGNPSVKQKIISFEDTKDLANFYREV